MNSWPDNSVSQSVWTEFSGRRFKSNSGLHTLDIVYSYKLIRYIFICFFNYFALFIVYKFSRKILLIQSIRNYEVPLIFKQEEGLITSRSHNITQTTNKSLKILQRQVMVLYRVILDLTKFNESQFLMDKKWHNFCYTLAKSCHTLLLYCFHRHNSVIFCQDCGKIFFFVVLPNNIYDNNFVLF